MSVRGGIARRFAPFIRAFDRALGSGLLVAASPVMLAAGIVVWRLSRRSPLVAHLRAGENGELFWMLKLRTMWPRSAPTVAERRLVERLEPAEVNGKSPRDERVTSRFAAWCRALSIDELPQLWHVARGEMALVGPRPLTPSELRRHYGDAMREVLSMRPGLTGLWQVMGRNRLTYRQRRRLDLFLVRRFCLRLYALILLRTVPRVLGAKDAW